MVRVGLILALAVGVALGAASPASAKGPVSAVIEGPGLSSPIALSSGDRLADLDNASGLLVELFDQNCKNVRGCIRRPDHPGPRYKVTYWMFTHEKVVQYIYPYAARGPITYVPAGQRFFYTQRSKGVWYAARHFLQQLLVDLGVPLTTSKAPLASPSSTDPGPRNATLLPFAIGSLMVITMIGGVVVALSRRSIASKKRAGPLAFGFLTSHLRAGPK